MHGHCKFIGIEPAVFVVVRELPHLAQGLSVQSGARKQLDSLRSLDETIPIRVVGREVIQVPRAVFPGHRIGVLSALGRRQQGLRRGRRRGRSSGRRRHALKTRIRQLDRHCLEKLFAGGRNVVLGHGNQAQGDIKVLPVEVMLLAGISDAPDVLQNPHIQPRELKEIHCVQPLQLARGCRVGNDEKLVVVSLFIGCRGIIVTGVGRRLRSPRRRRPAGWIRGHESGRELLVVGSVYIRGCVCSRDGRKRVRVVFVQRARRGVGMAVKGDHTCRGIR